jgi:hypothetical protein
MGTAIKIQIPPGIDNEDEDYTKTPKWVDCDKIRFRKNYPQKIGGWTRQSLDAAEGITRGYKVWRSGGSLSDVTPIRESGTLGADPFTTTDTSAIVSVDDTSHGLTADDIVSYSGATAVGGITIDGEYTVTTVTDANTYTITHSSVATSSATGGGASVLYEYYLPVGKATTVFGLGFGAGTYGTGTYGTARSASGLAFTARTWSISLWGEDLVINPRGQDIYLWDSSVGTSSRASIIAAAPMSNFVLVSPLDRHMIAFGCEQVTGDDTLDPLHIRWSDQEDYTDWTPSATNTSSFKQLNAGSEIVAAASTRNEILIFTKDTLTSMAYIGAPFVFSFDEIGTNCGLVGPQAVVNHGSTTYWMSLKNFYIYDGTLRPLPSPVHKHVFEDINTVQADKFFAGLNTQFQEVWFFYCSAASDEIDKYVIYNYEQNTWYYGTMVRTAWQDYGVLAKPSAISTDGYIYYHEDGVDDHQTAISAYLESGEFEFPQTEETGPGDLFTYMDRLIPDAEITGSVDFEIKTRRYPNATEITKGPYTLTSAITKTDFRARGRQWAVRWSSDDIGDDWRLGDQRFRVRPQGKQ